MALNFHNKKHSEGESFWTSYSDLFLGLSSIFLMLYVVASLRSGTDGIKNSVENQKLKVEIQDLQNQLKTYESLKESYMNTQASKSEVDEYTELMDKLTLLQDEANKEKHKLRQAAKENEQKEIALNKYQQMVRNVINASTMNKMKVNTRNEIISERDTTIDAQTQEITSLNQNIDTMSVEIKNKNREITNAQNNLKKQSANLKKMLSQQKLSQKAYQDRLKKLQEAAQAEIAQLQDERSATEQNLNQTRRQLASVESALNQTQSELGHTQSALSSAQGQLELKGAEISKLNQQIGDLSSENQAKIAGLQRGFAEQQAREKAAFDAELGRQKNLGAAEIARREAEFKAAADAKERKLAGEIEGLVGQLRDTEGKLASAQAELAARKKIAEEIAKGFKQAGVRADIDPNSGDVVLDFGTAHFDSDSANLKNEMKGVLQKAMPIYAKSLFGNSKVAKEISDVEIIGFASPTYRGKVVDPYSTSQEDRDALKYNMDLSYRRAKAIFNYILDEKNMNFNYRDTMVPNLKVSGRSFLELMKQDRSVASVQDYCTKHDCKKSQKVIIKFNMNKK